MNAARRGGAARLRGPTRVRRREREGGYVTAELAAALPAIVMLLLVGLFAVKAVGEQVSCADAAREAALAASRGADGTAAATRRAPPHARVSISGNGDTVTARVTARVRPWGTALPAVTVRGTATAAMEPGSVP